MSGSYWGNANQFWCYFDNDGYIVAQEFTGQLKRIGVSLQKHGQAEKIASEAMDKVEEYRKILEEHKLLPPQELTPEERLATLSSQVDTLTKLVQQQAEMIGAMTAKPRAVEPEILPSENAGGNLNDKYVAGSTGSQVLVSS